MSHGNVRLINKPDPVADADGRTPSPKVTVFCSTAAARYDPMPARRLHRFLRVGTRRRHGLQRRDWRLPILTWASAALTIDDDGVSTVWLRVTDELGAKILTRRPSPSPTRADDRVTGAASTNEARLHGHARAITDPATTGHHCASTGRWDV